MVRKTLYLATEDELKNYNELMVILRGRGDSMSKWFRNKLHEEMAAIRRAEELQERLAPPDLFKNID